MSNENPPAQPGPVATSKVAALFGPIRLLPGESTQAYKDGLIATITELGAKTHLQVYLAEKIFQCLWWIRRYEAQKQGAIINAMTDLLGGNGFSTTPKDQVHAITMLLQAERWDEPSLRKRMESYGFTAQSLQAKAMSNKVFEIQKFDQQIALRVKTLGQLQQSYEALVNRSVMQERLKLQNELLRRDLQAIDVPTIANDASSSDTSTADSKGKHRGKPKATGSE
jgi:hypothetical protein